MFFLAIISGMYLILVTTFESTDCVEIIPVQTNVARLEEVPIIAKPTFFHLGINIL
jgi:hypothetical protein